MIFREMDNLLPEKAESWRHRYLFPTPTPGPGSNLHRERSTNHVEGALCVRKLVRGGYNKAILEMDHSLPIFVWVTTWLQQRNLRESHPVSWRHFCPSTPGRKPWQPRRWWRLRDFPKRPLSVGSCGHQFWVPSHQLILPGHQDPSFVWWQCTQSQGKNHNRFKPILVIALPFDCDYYREGYET